MSDLSREPLDPDPFFDAMYAQFAARPLPSSRWPRPRTRARLPPTARLLRPVSLTGMGLAVAAVIAAVVLLLGPGGAGGPAPAYGVSFGSGNAITIHWEQFKQIDGLNMRLAQFHMRVRIVPIVRGCHAPAHQVVYAQVDTHQHTHVAPGPARTIEVAPPTPSTDVTAGTLTTYSDTLPGRTRIFAVSRSGGWTGDVFTVAGTVPSCVGDSR